MKYKIKTVITLLLLSMSLSSIAQVKLETLLKEKVERLPNTEVIMSRVAIPANTSLAKHWHPGEEFAYVLKGSVTLWQQGKKDTLLKAGDAVKIPVKQIHTAITGEEGVLLLITRIHEQGKPERVLIK